MYKFFNCSGLSNSYKSIADIDDAPIYDEHAHEIDFESYSPTSKSIIFKTIAKEEKMKKLKEK